MNNPSPPPSDDQISRHPIKRVRANGIEIAYLEAGRGPLVLLLHGFPDSAATWDETMTVLAARGFRAVAPFLRGYYPTEFPADGDYSILALARDALELMETLGEQQAIFVGHDWGATAAYAAANLKPERVRKLVTLAIPHPRVLKPDLFFFWRASHFVLFQFGALSEWYVSRNNFAYIDFLFSYWSPNWRVPEEQGRLVKALFAQPGRLRAALGFYRALRAGGAPGDAELIRSTTTVPALAFAGDTDGVLDTEKAFAPMPTAFSGPYKFVMIKGAGHFLHREKPDEFHRHLIAFLKE